jgi:succinyl-CoA synthetase beta subunit
MNLHEYQAKQIFRMNNIPVPQGIEANSPETAMEAAKKIKEITGCDKWAVKAQIHAGGRGKAGGVKIAKTIDEVASHANDILCKNLITKQTGPDGRIVRKLLIEQNIYYSGNSEIKELYVSILMDRMEGKYAFVYSISGGMDIEEVAEKKPELILKELVDPKIGFRPFQARKIAFNLGLSGKAHTEMSLFLINLYSTLEKIDASLIEINPVVKTSDDRIFAADAKIVLDDNALFRHPDLAEMRDINEEDPAEVEAHNFGLNFIKLDGNVGCMVNGAGLAMATMDIIKLSGGQPANFLDVGGAANAKTVEAGFRIILKDRNVNAILINIFGGIVRCDRVAQGVVEAYNNVGKIDVPVIVRLQGTNAIEAKKIIDKSGLKVSSAETLQEAADMVKQSLLEKQYH